MSFLENTNSNSLGNSVVNSNMSFFETVSKKM